MNEFYQEIVRIIAEANPRLDKYRSGGFINRDYDMARISIDLPIIEAKKLMMLLNQRGSYGIIRKEQK